MSFEKRVEVESSNPTFEVNKLLCYLQQILAGDDLLFANVYMPTYTMGTVTVLKTI